MIGDEWNAIVFKERKNKLKTFNKNLSNIFQLLKNKNATKIENNDIEAAL